MIHHGGIPIGRPNNYSHIMTTTSPSVGPIPCVQAGTYDTCTVSSVDRNSRFVPNSTKLVPEPKSQRDYSMRRHNSDSSLNRGDSMISSPQMTTTFSTSIAPAMKIMEDKCIQFMLREKRLCHKRVQKQPEERCTTILLPGILMKIIQTEDHVMIGRRLCPVILSDYTVTQIGLWITWKCLKLAIKDICLSDQWSRHLISVVKETGTPLSSSSLQLLLITGGLTNKNLVNYLEFCVKTQQILLLIYHQKW